MSARRVALALAVALTLGACGDDAIPTGASTGAGGDGSGAAGAGGAGAGGVGGAGQGGAGVGGAGGAGQGGGSGVQTLDDLLARLRADLDGTLLDESYDHGWPVLVEEGRVVVAPGSAWPMVAGDFDAWAGTALTADQGFSYAVLPDVEGARYKLTDGATFESDPWARAYDYDAFGEIAIVAPDPADAHLERWLGVQGASTLLPRTVRVWVPAEPPTHVLYAHDGQNLFDPEAFFGGWKLQDSAPPGMLIVGIDNTVDRMDEYTHVADDLGGGNVLGGAGDEYAALLEDVVRPLVAERYGEPAKVGLLGSSLGGLISLHIGYLNPTGYDFVGSMSGTLGWGSFGPHTGETMIERYDAVGVQPFVVYLDSGGGGATCADSDGDGIHDDDLEADDNYCETAQMRDVLAADGWVFDQNLFHWHEPGAQHDEAAWAARVFRPLDIFAAL